MPQVQAVNMQAAAPLGKILFASKAHCGIHGKPGGGDHPGAGAQHHQRCLKADFHPGAGDQRHLPLKRCGLKAFLIVKRRAIRAHGVVEKMQLCKFRLADIAVAGGFQIIIFRIQIRRKIRNLNRRGKDTGLPGKTDARGCPDAALMLNNHLAPDPVHFLVAFFKLAPVRPGELTGRGHEGNPLRFGKIDDLAAVIGQVFQKRNAVLNFFRRIRCFDAIVHCLIP